MKTVSEQRKQRIRSQLFVIIHPEFLDAEIDPDVTWKLTCGHCGQVHKFSTDTVELDPCCGEPMFGAIKE